MDHTEKFWDRNANGYDKEEMKEKPAVIHEQVALSYHQYQKCGMKGARKLFATGW